MEPSQSYSFLPSWMQWIPSQPQDIQKAEEKILQMIENKYETTYVDSGDLNGSPVKIWTLVVHPIKEDVNKVPLVLIHGMAAGSALFAKNADVLARENRKIYVIDLPGFARSSRPDFSKYNGEEEYVECFEAWRKSLNLERFHLLGHSFGGYLSSAYALKYSNRVKHLILCDPWGMTDVPEALQKAWYANPALFVATRFNPLFWLRFTGPFGPTVIKSLRWVLLHRFEKVFGNDDYKIFADYIFHINAHYPSGESAFYYMMKNFIWSKNPMLPRLKHLKSELPLTVINGDKSWMATSTQGDYDDVRKPNSTYTKVHFVEEGTHHLYADNLDKFTEIVNDACDMSDSI